MSIEPCITNFKQSDNASYIRIVLEAVLKQLWAIIRIVLVCLGLVEAYLKHSKFILKYQSQWPTRS